MPTSLSAPTLRTVERLWQERMGAPKGALGSAGVSFVEWPGLTAAVILDIGGVLLVAGPSEAIGLLRRLARAQLLDVEVAGSALGSLRPELVGRALLGYADVSTFTPVHASYGVRQADRSSMEEVVSQCDPDDRDESGLLEMHGWFVAEEEGVPVAAAGYEEWPGGVAHCGVAVSAEHRGRGLGRSVASAAVGHALGEHEVVQWRSRDTNAVSTRLGARLGFVQLGAQVAFDLYV